MGDQNSKNSEDKSVDGEDRVLYSCKSKKSAKRKASGGLCADLKKALKRTIPRFGEKSFPCKKGRTKISLLMDALVFDLNQLLIYESLRCRPNKEVIVRRLRTVKIKIDEINTIARRNVSLATVDVLLKRKDKLKCMSQTFRRKFIYFIANIDCFDRRNLVACKIMKYLDSLDRDISRICEIHSVNSSLCSSPCSNVPSSSVPKPCSSKGFSSPCSPQRSLTQLPCSKKSVDCGSPMQTICETENSSPCLSPEIPRICVEVMKPFCKEQDEDAQSIHLRYVPELDSFKAGMARNPCALRLPLMCPSMRKIMNKMKVDYLMDDVPICLSKVELNSELL